MKYYAAIGNEVPQHILVKIMGAVDSEDGVFYTQPFESKNHLLALVGTVQSRMEREGREFDGACILPYGAKIPTKRYKFKVNGPLKARTDYGAFPEKSQILEMRSPHNKFYAAEQEAVASQTVIVPPNEYYDNGLTTDNINAHYAMHASEIIHQFDRWGQGGSVVFKVDKDTYMRRTASDEIQLARIFGTFNAGNSIELHFASGKDTKQVWVEVNPKGELPWLIAKRVAADIYRVMSNLDGAFVTTSELRFSGDSGFHVVSHIFAPMNINDARAMVERAVELYAQDMGDSRLNASTLDCSSMQEGRGLRVPFSISRTSGLMCLPLNPSELFLFDRIDAMIRKGADDKKAPTLKQQLITKLKLSPERMNQVEAEIAKMTPAEIKDLSAQLDEFGEDVSVQIDPLHADIMKVIREVGYLYEAISDSLGTFDKLYDERESHLTPIYQGIAELPTLSKEAKDKVKHGQQLRAAIYTKLRSGGFNPVAILRHHVEKRFIQNKEALAKLKEMLARLKGLNRRGGYVAEYLRIKARGFSAEKLIKNALMIVDKAIEVFGVAASDVHKSKVLPIKKTEAEEAVMDYPMTGEFEQGQTLESAIAETISLMRQANSELDSANAVLQDMLEEANSIPSIEEDVEALAAEIGHDFMRVTDEDAEITMRYGISIAELDALRKWLKVVPGKLSNEELNSILALHDKDPQAFESMTTNILHWLAPPVELEEWVNGIRALRARSSQNMSIQDFKKQYELAPWSDDIKDLVQYYKEPLVASFPPKVIEGVLDMRDRLDPLAYQRYIEVIMGMVIPVENLDTFTERLKDAYSLLPQKEASENPMFAWEFLDLQEKYAIVKARQESQNGGQDV